MSDEQRLDAVLVNLGYATGRDKAKELIRLGSVTVNGKTASKPSQTVSVTDVVECTTEMSSFVGRGGLKLQHAFSLLPSLPTSFVAMDVGASTGGFTQCLLQHGAKKVYAVDVGHGQLHPSLLSDERVVNLEGTDIRNTVHLKTIISEQSIDMVSVDVSFISLRTVLPSILPFVKPNGWLVLLIKPQFEAGKAAVGKNGVVHDRRVHYRVLLEQCNIFAGLGLSLHALTASPIVGGVGRRDGNIEYLAILQNNNNGNILPDIRLLVDTAFSELK